MYILFGHVYSGLGQLEKSIAYYEKAIKTLQGKTCWNLYCYILLFKGIVHKKLGEYDKSLVFFNLALTSIDEIQLKRLSQRIFAEHRGMYPDGICLDVEGAIWVADPRNKEVIRVKEGGEILERVLLGDRGAYACTLGGADGCTLFICTNTDSGPENAADRAGKIEFTQVAVPGAGSP